MTAGSNEPTGTPRALDTPEFPRISDYATYWAAHTPDAEALAEQSCTPNCPYYDFVKEMYERTDPGYEFIANLSGGAGAGTLKTR